MLFRGLLSSGLGRVAFLCESSYDMRCRRRVELLLQHAPDRFMGEYDALLCVNIYFVLRREGEMK